MTDSVRAFERGLRVIRIFGADRRELTLSEVAQATDLNRATARRLLLTLEELGYARRVRDRFALTPRVLELGFAYLAALGVPEIALPYLEQLSAEVRESTSLGVLDDTAVTYVGRVPASRIMTVSIGLGTRLPAYRTSLGRALLSALTDEEVAIVWERTDRSDPTPTTVQSLPELLERLAEVRRVGFALVDQELELGVRSIAAPLHDAGGRTVAAVNIGTHTSRTSMEELRASFVPALVRTAADIDRALASRPS
jgi:IclR family transcriptional regulator, pca regulon regulatory protein